MSCFDCFCANDKLTGSSIKPSGTAKLRTDGTADFLSGVPKKRSEQGTTNAGKPGKVWSTVTSGVKVALLVAIGKALVDNFVSNTATTENTTTEYTLPPYFLDLFSGGK